MTPEKKRQRRLVTPARRGEFPVSKRQANVTRTHAKIIAAVRDMLSDGGFSSLNLGDVQKRAGVARSTIHYQFDSRVGVLQALVDDALTRSQFDLVRQAYSIRDAVEALQVSIKQICHFWASDYVVFRRLTALAVMDSDAYAALQKFEDERYKRACELVDKLVAQHRLAPGYSWDRAVGLVCLATSYQAFEQLLLALGTQTQVAKTLVAICRCLYDENSTGFASDEDGTEGNRPHFALT